MTKKQIFYLGLFASIITLSSGFRPFQSELFPWFHVFEKEITYTVPTEVEVGQTFFDIPFTGKTFVGFQQSLAARESQGKYHKVNSFGYLGKYQFGSQTLESLGIDDEKKFLKSRKLQEKAFIAYLARNKWEYRVFLLPNRVFWQQRIWEVQVLLSVFYVLVDVRSLWTVLVLLLRSI
jgi:hypothetical protein